MLLNDLFALLCMCTVFATPILVEKRYTAIRIKSYRNNECLHPNGDKSTWGPGTQVGTTGCDKAAMRTASPGSGNIVLYNTDLVVDAGTGIENGEQVTLAAKSSGKFQQTWYWTIDDRLAITGGTQCLDQGSEEEGTQTWKCISGNTNQIWICQTPIPENPVFDPPLGNIYDDSSTGGKRLHPVGRSDLALTLDGGFEMSGRSAVIAYSQPNESPNSSAQLLNLTIGSGIFVSSLHDSTTCLDAGYDPHNGAIARFINCGEAARWDWDGSKLKLFNQNLCLDVQAESVRLNEILKRLQVWECIQGNTNQEFFTLT
ncbi:uncharacterized protein IL334_001429 [Kwoniella shivajii]|uniref:Ricin B lectin domain-containing protein n=1 Tax=Kwoniella shivajii TaxID=564305 RepID=A0ABZ1CW40_9TREE|nr:hypothetical protein IL334_001429 [Kwoniella shivajii]